MLICFVRKAEMECKYFSEFCKNLHATSCMFFWKVEKLPGSLLKGQMLDQMISDFFYKCTLPWILKITWTEVGADREGDSEHHHRVVFLLLLTLSENENRNWYCWSSLEVNEFIEMKSYNYNVLSLLVAQRWNCCDSTEGGTILRKHRMVAYGGRMDPVVGLQCSVCFWWPPKGSQLSQNKFS